MGAAPTAEQLRAGRGSMSNLVLGYDDAYIARHEEEEARTRKAQDEWDAAKTLKAAGLYGQGAIDTDLTSEAIRKAAQMRPLSRWSRGSSFLTGPSSFAARGSLLTPPSLFPSRGVAPALTATQIRDQLARENAPDNTIKGNQRGFLRAVNGPKGLRSFNARSLLGL